MLREISRIKLHLAETGGADANRADGRDQRWYSRPLVRNAFAYGLAVAALAFVAHDVSLSGMMRACAHARLWIFLPACIFSMVCWLCGETFLFSRLFSYFHTRTTFREMLSANAMQEFLQIIDMVVASTAIVAFVNRRKKVPFLAVGCIMLTQGIVDLQVIAWMAMLAIPWATGLPIHVPWRYPALVIVATWSLALLWPRVSASSTLRRWLWERPSMRAFRTAHWNHYAKLSAIRAVIFAAQGLVLYLELLSFNVRAPVTDVFALESMILLLGALPIAPAGLGVRQILTVGMLAAFGSKTDLLAASLAHSAAMIVLRVALGLIFAGAFMRTLAEPSAPVDMRPLANVKEPTIADEPIATE